MALTIILADDHPISLDAQEDFRVVAEVGDGIEAVRLAERLTPRVLIVDVMMPGLDGLEVTRQVGRRSSHTRVIILSMYSNEACVFEALRNGAAGYVLKEASATELIQAVREVAACRRYLSRPTSSTMLCEAASCRWNPKPSHLFPLVSFGRFLSA